MTATLILANLEDPVLTESIVMSATVPQATLGMIVKPVLLVYVLEFQNLPHCNFEIVSH